MPQFFPRGDLTAGVRGHPGGQAASRETRRDREEENLHRLLVAGLMLEGLLEWWTWPPDPAGRRHRLKTRLKRTLVDHLAGHTSLETFRTLSRKLDDWFDQYYPLLCSEGPACAHRPRSGAAASAFSPEPEARRDFHL